jgi:paired amphipathic helix protein Sin3a
MNNQPVHGGGGGYDRDREMMERQRASDEIAQRERENERSHREPYHSGAPLHSSAGSLPIHQPVASRISGAIHSPGGLLANHGSSAPSIALGAPPGPVANFGGPLNEQGSRTSGQHGNQNNAAPSHQLYNPAGHSSAPTTSLVSAGGPGSSQPIFGGPLPVQESQASIPQGQPGPANAPGPQAPAGPGGPVGPGGPGVAQAQQPILTVSSPSCHAHPAYVVFVAVPVLSHEEGSFVDTPLPLLRTAPGLP